MTKTVISIKDLSKYYKLYKEPKDRLKEALNPFGKKYHHQFYALKNINLEIKKGEILGIVGKNGSGKSTLLKLICGVLTPSNGAIQVDGKISALLELGAGFNPEFSGLNNIYFYATILGLSNKEIDEKIDDIIAFADLGEFINQPIKTYSSGMKARLGFAVAVHIDPEILILDEVLAVGDALFRRKCYAKMEEFFNNGKTIIYTSHDANSVNKLCTRAVFIESGNVLLDGKPKFVTTYYEKYLFSQAIDGGKKILQEIEEQSRLIIKDKKEPLATKKMNNYFIKGLESKAKTEYKHHDIDIMDAKIVDEYGMEVNVLSYGNDYNFLANVRFGVPARNVSFGFELKDIQGVKISSVESSALYQKDYYLKRVSINDVIQIKFNFRCLFCEGLYFINLGVSSFNKEQEILNRIVDLSMFKVKNSIGISRGYVELVNYVDIIQSEGEKIFVPIMNEIN